MISIRVGVTLAALCLVTTGCALIKVKKEFKKSLESTVIIGRVFGEFTGNGPIIVAACSTNNEMEIANYTVLHNSGEYELAVSHGNYYVFGFQDKNSNLIYDAGEPAGQHGNPKLVHATAVGVVYDINMEIPKEGGKITIPHGTEISSVKPKKLYSRQACVIADLDDERFSEEYGIKGFWEGISFFKELGGNICQAVLIRKKGKIVIKEQNECRRLIL